MRLRQLKFPIVRISDNGLLGGVDAGLGGPSKYNVNNPSYYEDLGYHVTTIVDCTGAEFKVENVEFHEITLFQLVVAWFILSQTKNLANVDMILSQTYQWTVEEFQNHYKELVLNNRDWWRNWSQNEIENLFDGCDDFKSTINDVGVLLDERAKFPKPPPGFLIDLRKQK
ncbi:MAG: hypothetical protein AAFV38_07655 [Pseudomonadota bacterium]